MKSSHFLLKYALVLFSIASIVSCKKSENDTQEKSSATFGNIAFFANASASGIKTTSNTKVASTLQSDTVANTVEVNWSSASVWVEKITFTGKNGQLLDTTIMVKKKLDIFNADALMGVIKLPAGSYKDINVKMFCRKNSSAELGLDFIGTFTNTKGGKDSLMVRSSIAFEADLNVNDIVINPADNYKATFHFDLSKVLTGISNSAIENTLGNQNSYVIWKGGSADVPFYKQIIENWQNVASIVIIKESAHPNWDK